MSMTTGYNSAFSLIIFNMYIRLTIIIETILLVHIPNEIEAGQANPNYYDPQMMVQDIANNLVDTKRK